MKTLILYTSKHGATREIAERIAKQIGAATLFNLNDGKAPPLDEYDAVLIGSPVYAGQVRSEIKTFAAQHADILKTKTLGLFLSGINQEGMPNYLDANFPKEIVTHAKATAMLGGVFDPAKAGFFEKLIMRAVAKKSTYTNTLSDEEIKRFMEALRA